MQLNVSTRLLRAFLALSDCRHFTNAAARCSMSQSAFSALIRKLENQVGLKLFERDTRHVALTPEGELFAEAAQRLVADIEFVFSDLEEHVARRRGRVAIAALPSLAAGALPPLVAEYRKRYPGITVTLFDALSDYCCELVRRGKADLALTAPGPGMSEFDSWTLCSDRFYFVCARNDPLAKRKLIRLQQLAGREFIHMAAGSSVRQHVEVALQFVPVINIGIEPEHLATVAGLVANGLGVTLVPELTLFHFQRPELMVIPLADPSLVRPIFVVKRKGQPLSIAALGMLQLIKERLSRENVPKA